MLMPYTVVPGYAAEIRQGHLYLKFFDRLNRLHSSLSFTMEEESNGQLPFLDVLVERGDYSFLTCVCSKPTFTGLYLNWHSFAPKLGNLI